MTFLKQSTAATVKIGPFVDTTDAVTAETGLTIAQADIRLSKNGGAFAQTNNATGATHDENGYYGVPLDTTDTGTLGTLRVAVTESGALPVWQDFMVVPANVWDSMFGADKLQVDLTQVNGAAQTATLDTIKTETAAILVDTGTTLDGKLNTIDSNVDAILLDTAEIGTAGAGLTNINLPDQTMNITGNITGNLSGSVGSVTGAVGSVTGNVGGSVASLGAQAKLDVNAEVDTALADYDPPTNAEMEARTLLAASYATAANQTTIAGYIDTEIASILAAVDTEIAAIKAKTDQLTFTTANQVDANIQSVNDTAVGGDGAEGTEWGPA